MKIDAHDCAILAGFVAVVLGIGLLSVPWAFIAGGLGLLGFGIYGSWLKGAQGAGESK